MVATLESATNEMYAVVKAAWEAACAANDLSVGILIFDIVGTDGNPPTPLTTPWARVGSNVTNSRVRSIGGILWQNDGLLSVTMHFPQRELGKSAGTIAQRFGAFVSNRLRIHRIGNVEFVSVTPSRRGQDGPFYRHDVTAQFRFYSATEG